MVDVALTGPGIWVDDEVQKSGDPPKHALDLCSNAAANGFKFVCCAMQGITSESLQLVKQAAVAHGIHYSTWAQGLQPSVVLDRLRRGDRGAFHAVCLETREEEQAWSDQHLDMLVALMTPIGCTIICTQTPWDGKPGVPDPELAKRWISRGFAVLPEANLAENPGATVDNMVALCEQLKWPPHTIAPVCYLINDPQGKPTPASRYTDQIHNRGSGAWSVYRYGDIDAADWLEMRAWPHTVAQEPPQPPPPPPVPPPADVSPKAARQLMQLTAELAAGAAPTDAFLRSRVGLAWRVLRSKDDPFLKVNRELDAYMRDRGL